MLNIAIVGTGNIAPAHVEGLLTFPDRCRIVALCDIYPEKAQAMKEKNNLSCEVFDDHQKMLASLMWCTCAPRLTPTRRSPSMPWTPEKMCWWKNRWPPA